jgi:hypothetical protein
MGQQEILQSSRDGLLRFDEVLECITARAALTPDRDADTGTSWQRDNPPCSPRQRDGTSRCGEVTNGDPGAW